MKLEALTLEVRPRTPWEAIDLAVRLVMTHWRLLFTSWLVTIVPLVVIINLLLLEDYPIWAFFIVWFLKPLYDRIPLFVLSRVIFAEHTTYKDVLNAVPALLKTGILSSLTLHRLDPGRAFSLPVSQLEGLKGKRRRQRMNILRRGTNNREILLLILCLHLETIISWGLIGLLLMMLPVNMALQNAETLFLNEEPGLLINMISMAFYFMVMMLVESLYIAGGFVLYLNRRIILEGWDIELVFRKLTIRQAKHKSSLQNIALVLTSSVLFFAASTYTDNAQAAAQNASSAYEVILPPLSQPPLSPEAAAQVIKEVMAEPVFNRYKQVEELKYTGKKNTRKNKLNEDYFWLVDAFESIGKILALLFEVGLWIIVLIVVFLVVKYRDRLHLGIGQKKQSAIIIPETLFGLDLREESLPDNVPEQVLLLYRQQDYRAAMALLYRATLAFLVKNHQFDLKKGATEGDCLMLMSKKLASSAAELNYFTDLTRSWQLTAYAHEVVGEEKMQQLCLSWSDFYEQQEQNVTSETSSATRSATTGIEKTGAKKSAGEHHE